MGIKFSIPVCFGGTGHVQLSRGLSEEGALLLALLLLLILQLFSNPNVVLHKLVLLDVGRIVFLNCRGKASQKT